MVTLRTVHWLSVVSVVGAVLTLAACGGGDSPEVEPPPLFVPSGDRIEPFDPGLGKVRKALASAPPAVLAALPAASVRLGALAASALPLPQDAATTTGKLVRQQAGEHGMQRAAIRFEADGAHGIRLGLRVHDLPPGTVLRFYAQAGAQVFQVSGEEVLRTLARNRQAGETGDAARTYWSPDFGGAETTLEVQLPADADLARLEIAVPTLSHFFVAPDAVPTPTLAKVGEAGRCNIDVTCRSEYSAESRSVARMLFVDPDGSSYLCTGTLLNDAHSSATPYFLSARHCVGTQSAASSLVTDWFYRSSACNSGQPYAGTQRLYGGADLLYAEAATDTVFMRLNAAPPGGVVFAGSYLGALDTGIRVAGIHHPGGDLQKLSEGVVRRFENCTPEACTGSTPQAGRFLTVGWSAGTTESGSSGSGLFLPIGSRRYVVGQFLGGDASCQNPGGDERYGRFDVAFHVALKTWLKPDAGSSPLLP